MDNQFSIFSIPIACYNREQFQLALRRKLVSPGKLVIAKINTEYLSRAMTDSNFQKLLESGRLNIADGRGVLWAAKYLSMPATKNKPLRVAQCILQMIYSGMLIVLKPKFIETPIPCSFPGVEALELIVEAAVQEKSGVYIFGAQQEILDQAIRRLETAHRGLKIVGSTSGYGFDTEEVVANINSSGAKVLFVALGSPKQEYWIEENLDKLETVKIAVGEGGTFDRVASPKRKAPIWLNRLGLEWLWRLFMNKDLTGGGRVRRVWDAVPLFVVRIVSWKVTNA